MTVAIAAAAAERRTVSLRLVVLVAIWRVGRGDLRRCGAWQLLALGYGLMVVTDAAYAILAMPDHGVVSSGLSISYLFAFIALMYAYVLWTNENFLVNSKDPEWAHIAPFRWLLRGTCVPRSHAAATRRARVAGWQRSRTQSATGS